MDYRGVNWFPTSDAFRLLASDVYQKFECGILKVMARFSRLISFLKLTNFTVITWYRKTLRSNIEI